MEDYEELMLQISDVMREANRVFPDLSHEQAIKNIRGIVERHGKWIEKEDYVGDTYYDCSNCGNSWSTLEGTPWQNGMSFCPNCGARMDR